MKKLAVLFVVLLVLVGAGLGGACWWFGVQTQKQYDALLAQKEIYLRDLGHLIEISGKTYDRGLFSSTSVASVTLNPSGETKPIQFTVENRVHHGPIIFGNFPHVNGPVTFAMAVLDTRVRGEEENAEAVKKILEKIPELKGTTLITVLHPDGSGESWIDVPAFKKDLADDSGKQTHVEWNGMTVDSRFNIGIPESSATLGAPQLEVKDAEGSLVVKNFKGNLKLRRGAKGLVTGDTNFLLDLIEFCGADGQAVFRLDGVGLGANSDAAEEFANGSLLVKFAKLLVEKLTFGPFAFELETRKLDVNALAEFQEKAGEMQSKIAGKSPEEIWTIMKPYYSKLATALLAKSPEIEIKQFNGNTPWGGFSLHFLVSVSGGGGSVIENPLLLLTNLNAGLDASASEQLVKQATAGYFSSDLQKSKSVPPAQAAELAAAQAEGILKALADQKMVIREGGNIKTSASFKSGQLKVNGKPLNFGELLK